MRARDNPFRTERVLQARYRPQGTTWEALMDRLAALRYRAAIVGPDGSGKTTLLEDLEPRLAALGFGIRWLRLDTANRAFAPGFLKAFFAGLGEREAIFFDGADLLGRLAWPRFRRRARKAAGLIITSHRAGLLPTLVECSTSPELLEKLIREIAADSRAGAQLVARGLALALFERHRGDLRAALRELYDLYAALPI